MQILRAKCRRGRQEKPGEAERTASRRNMQNILFYSSFSIALIHLILYLVKWTKNAYLFNPVWLKWTWFQMNFIVLMITMPWLYLLLSVGFLFVFFTNCFTNLYFMRIWWQTENEIFGCLFASFIPLYSYLLQHGAIIFFWIIYDSINTLNLWGDGFCNVSVFSFIFWLTFNDKFQAV